MNEILEALLLNKIGGGGGYPEPTGTKQITANGTGIDVKNYATADVNVPNSYQQGDEGKVVQSGALVAQTQKTINANGTVDTTANNSVVVNVPNSYASSDEGKVVQSGALVAQTQRAINANGTVDTTTNNSVVVNVPTGGLIKYRAKPKTKTVFKNDLDGFRMSSSYMTGCDPLDTTLVLSPGDEVLAWGDIGSTGKRYYITGVVNYISVDDVPIITVKGIGVNQPVADGTYSANANGTYDVSEYSSVNVSVQGSGTTYITENGTHDVGGYRYANVNVESGGGDVNILFATNATYQDQPVQGNSCSAEVLDIDLSSYSEGDKVVLYGVEPNMTGGNFLVVGTITSFSFPSVVYFDVDEVSEISGGGGKGAEITIITGATLDVEPQKGSEVRVTPSSSSDIDNLGTDDLVFVQGDASGTNCVFAGSVTNNYGTEITVNVKNVSYVYESNVVKLSGAIFRDTPSSGSICTVALSDPSEAYNVSSGDGVMVTGNDEQTGSTYAVYGRASSVETSFGKIELDVGLVEDFSS